MDPPAARRTASSAPPPAFFSNLAPELVLWILHWVTKRDDVASLRATCQSCKAVAGPKFQEIHQAWQALLQAPWNLKGIPYLKACMKPGSTQSSVGDSGFVSLSKALATGALPHLEDLCLSRNGIHDDGMEAFADALSKAPLDRLTKLDLDMNHLCVAGTTALADVMSTGLPKLEALYLNHMFCDDTSDVCTAALAKGFSKGLLDLRYLRLCSNHIGDAGITALANTITEERLPNLRVLYLTDNKIGDEGFSNLAAAMSSLGSLLYLSLRRNRIGDIGITAFSEVVSQGALGHLEFLDLECNEITDIGLHSLITSAPCALKSLQMLTLDINRIGDRGLLEVAHAVSMNALVSLKDLAIMNNRVDFLDQPELRAACHARGIVLT